MKKIVYFLLFTLSVTAFAQEGSLFSKPNTAKKKKAKLEKLVQIEDDSIQQDIAINRFIDGTLLKPEQAQKPNLVILIAGSGPTDRNGNQNFLINDAIKKTAIGLRDKGIASYRYDKRIVKQIKKGKVDPNINFRDFVTDAIAVIKFMKASKKFNHIYVAGHSQGSLVALAAANKEKVNGVISLAGAGQSIDGVIKEQINKTAPMFNADTELVLQTLKSGKTTDKFPEALASIFNLGVQPFMISWMRYNPIKEIKKLSAPVLIINGTKDLQVSEKEAQALKDAKPKAELKIIENMNHVLVTVEGDDLENAKTYNKAKLPLADGLIDSIAEFIGKTSK